jgi:hypothetical protein
MRFFFRSRKATIMENVIYAAGIAGFVLLIFVTVSLVKLNWSDKSLAPILSILLVGTATTLVTVAVPLKSSTIDSAFAASVVLDTAQGAPPMGTLANTKVNQQLNELTRLARPAINNGGKTEITVTYPKNLSEMFAFGGELLQYRLIHVIQELQRGGWKAGYSFGASVATVTAPISSPDAELYSPQQVLATVASNRFSNSDMERVHWEHTKFSLPPKTKLTLLLPSASGGNYVVTLDKPLFFQINFAIEPLLGTSSGALPEGLALRPEVSARCQTYHYRITMSAKFERITAGNSRTQEYKDWVNRLFSGVQDKLGD